MTIATSTNKHLYAGTGAQTVYPYLFRIWRAEDLRVVLRDASGTETLLNLGSDYTVTGVGNEGGGLVTVTGQAPVVGSSLLLKRQLEYVQETDLVENAATPAKVFEDAFDRITAIAQQLKEEIDRTLKVKETSSEALASAEEILDAVGDLSAAAGAAEQAIASAAIAKANAEQTSTDRIACDADAAATALAKGEAVAAASAAQGYATSAEAHSAAPAWSPATSYSFPDITAYTDGNTYRCTGTDIVGEAPDTSANWVRLTTRMTDFFDLDDGGDLMPAVTPGYSVEFELDVNGDVQPR